MSTGVIPKKKGRPATGRDPVTAIRLPAEMVSKIDAWAAERGIRRSVAIRAMIDAVLKMGGLDK
jgi:predicted DNA-binding protein